MPQPKINYRIVKKGKPDFSNEHVSFSFSILYVNSLKRLFGNWIGRKLESCSSYDYNRYTRNLKMETRSCLFRLKYLCT